MSQGKQSSGVQVRLRNYSLIGAVAILVSCMLLLLQVSLRTQDAAAALPVTVGLALLLVALRPATLRKAALLTFASTVLLIPNLVAYSSPSSTIDYDAWVEQVSLAVPLTSAERPFLRSLLEVSERQGTRAAVAQMLAQAKWTHEVAHGLGMYALAKYRDPARALLECEDDPIYGCQHGVIMSQVGERTEITPEQWERICDFVPAGADLLVRNCWHVLTHNLAQIVGGDVPRMLYDYCDTIPLAAGRFACATVALTEGIEKAYAKMAAGKEQAHLRKDDLLYPCNAAVITDIYKSACYQVQIRAIKYQLGADWVGAAPYCSQEPDLKYRAICYRGLGLLWTSADTRMNDREYLAICAAAADKLGRDNCAMAVFQNPRVPAEMLVAECPLLSAGVKSECYSLAAGRIRASNGLEAAEALCIRVETAYLRDCRSGAGLP